MGSDRAGGHHRRTQHGDERRRALWPRAGAAGGAGRPEPRRVEAARRRARRHSGPAGGTFDAQARGGDVPRARPPSE